MTQHFQDLGDTFDLERPVTREEIIRFRTQTIKARRERIATAILAEIAAAPWDCGAEEAVPVAIRWADYLIAELDRD